MTAQQPPFFLADAGTSHDAEGFRRFTAMLAGTSGVYESGDMIVAQRGAGANMSVDVAGGRGMIAGDQATYQGSYFVENRGVRNVTISAADSTNPRWDLIVARVRDSAYSGGDDDWDIVAVTGTPAASPAEPTLPQNAIRLARVVVGAGVSSIVNANITDQRYHLFSLLGASGLRGYGASGSNQTGITTSRVDITGATTGAITIPTGRVLRIECFGGIYHEVSDTANWAAFTIMADASDLFTANSYLPAAVVYSHAYVTGVVQGTVSGSVTIKVQGATNASFVNTMTGFHVAVWDMGPVV